MTARTLLALSLLSLCLLGSLGALPGGEAATPASCPEGRATRSLTSDLHLSASNPQAGVFVCETVLARGNVTVASGGRLVLNNSALVLRGFPGTTVHVRLEAQSGARIEATAGSSITDDPAMPRPFDVRLLTGSSVLLEASEVKGYRSLHVGTNDATFRGRIDESATDGVYAPASGDAITVLGANPRLERVRLQGGQVGLRIQGAAEPSLLGVRTEGASLAGVFIESGARARAEASHLGSQGIGALVVGSGRLTHANGSLPSAPIQVRAEASGAGSPRVLLHGTTHDPLKIQLVGAAHVEAAWFSTAHVVEGEPSGANLHDALVEWRNATGASKATARTVLSSGVGATPPRLLPDWSRTGAAPEVRHSPYSILVRQGSSVAHRTVSIDQNGPVEVPLPHDIDNEPPAWPPSGSGLAADSGPMSASGAFTLTWSPADDNPSEAHPNRAIDRYEVYHFVGEASTILETTQNELRLENVPDGNHSFKVVAVDLAGNRGPFSPEEVRVWVDRVPPWVRAATNISGGPVPGHFRTAFRVTLTALDNATGVGAVEYRIGESGAFQPYAAPVEFSTPGVWNLTVRVRDRAGGVVQSIFRYRLDDEAPTLVASLSPAQPDGAAGWYRSEPQLSLTAVDRGSGGLHLVRYRAGSGAWTPYELPTSLSVAGDAAWFVEASDKAGNVATTVLRTRIDTVPPQVTLALTGTSGAGGWYRSAVEAAVQATDDASGVQQLEYRLGTGPWIPFVSPLRLEHDGALALQVRAVDVAGHASEPRKADVRIDSEAPVPPEVRFVPLTEGMVRLEWAAGLPLDLVSGVAGMRAEQADAKGAIVRSFPVPLSGNVALIGPLPNGEVPLRVVVQDVAGNNVQTPFVAVRVQSSPLRALETGDALPVRGRVAVAYVPPAGFEPVEVLFHLDGRLVYSTAEPPYVLAWDTQGARDGPHQIRIVAVDASGAQHEEWRSYELRNAWIHKVEDEPVSFVAAAGITAAGAAAAATMLVRSRRWGL